MRYLLFIILTVVAYVCKSADYGLKSSPVVVSWKYKSTPWIDPSGSNTLFAWWVASDVPMGWKVGQTNPWIDRIQGIVLSSPITSVANWPSNTVDGLGFSGVSVVSALTNEQSKINPGSSATFALILTPTRANAGGTDILLSTNINGHLGFNSLFLKNTLQIPSGTAVSGNIVVTTNYDIVGFQNAGTMTWNTNGVQSKTSSIIFGVVNGIGLDFTADSCFKGYIKEFLVWSNSFSATQLANFHKYATNTYLYGP